MEKTKLPQYTVQLILPRFYSSIFHGIRESQLTIKPRERNLNWNQQENGSRVVMINFRMRASFINSSSSLSRSSSALANFFSSSSSASAQSAASESRGVDDRLAPWVLLWESVQFITHICLGSVLLSEADDLCLILVCNFASDTTSFPINLLQFLWLKFD